ncbi:ankyrin repeat and SAM domain-containing protein 1A-like [Lytechinus variegatus]|uniref:ankyrin repeat and SAM domain-containing protein 1A-like n=1 Tax=Lytechinus variegatus TaxID=7654 RepID=UPI001BB10E26|nr:ankyrin repeat and SAM domain-containing protein 1A-like [Lytechinus variegatus]
MGKENDLLEAARTGNVVTIGKLLSGGRGRSVITAALSFRRALGPNCQDSSGYTPLHHAVLNGHRDAVQMLLKFDASPTVPDNRGSNPLHLAAWTGNVEIVQTLLTVGVSKDQVNEQNNYWDTPLHFAAQYGHTDVVSILLENGADPTLCNRKEEGPLDLAAQYGRQDTVQLLVRLRPDLLAKIPDSRSLLHLAAKNGHHRIVKLLLDAGCDINKTTKTGTALHEAAVFGKIDVVRVLLEARPSIDVEIEDGHSETALQKIESHSSKVSQEISKMIMAHIRGEPLPKPIESSPSTPMTDSSDSDPNSPLAYSYVTNSASNPSIRPNPGLVAPGFEVIDHANIYDNVPEDRSALYARHYQTHAELRSSSPEGVLRRGASKLQRSSPRRSSPPDQDLYMNVTQINQQLSKLMPPKKPQRNSIGILLDQNSNGNSPQMERKQDQERSASPMHLDVRGPHSRQSNTLSSQDSDCPPPLPDRNYYDLDQAGEYTQLRRDAVPPKQQQQQTQHHPHPPQQPPPKQQLMKDQDYSTVTPLQDYDIMNEGVSNTSTEETSDDTHGSLYETLSNAQSGVATPEVPYPPYEMGSKPPHPQVQLHIHEPDDNNDLDSTGDGGGQLDDEEDLDAYEFLSNAVTGHGQPKPKPRITPTSSSSSSVPSTDSASVSHSKPKPLPRRNKPVPARRSPGSMSSQPSTPSEELTSSSDHWGGASSDRPTTPDQPPPSPNTAMMGIRAKLGASEPSSDAPAEGSTDG